MDVYIYQAALFCTKCAQNTMDECSTRDPKAAESEDSDDFPQGPYPGGGGEADTFQHCGGCGVFLENPLTSDGLEDALNSVEEYVVKRAGYSLDTLPDHLDALDALHLDPKDWKVVDLARRCMEADVEDTKKVRDPLVIELSRDRAFRLITALAGGLAGVSVPRIDDRDANSIYYDGGRIVLSVRP